MDNGDKQELTFGQKAVGLTFNPSNNVDVQSIKEKCAVLIDELNNYKTVSFKDNPDIARMLSVAITEVQTAQMWAVKAVTWTK